MNQSENEYDVHRYTHWRIPDNETQHGADILNDYSYKLVLEQWKNNSFQVSDPRKDFKFNKNSISPIFTTKFKRILYEYDPQYSVGSKPSRYILFSNLPSSTVPSSLSTKLAPFGQIQSIDILRNPTHGYCDGYALAVFKDMISSNRLMIAWKLGLLSEIDPSTSIKYDENGSDFEKHSLKSKSIHENEIHRKQEIPINIKHSDQHINSIISSIPHLERKRSHESEINIVKKHLLTLLRHDIIHHIYTKNIFDFVEEQMQDLDISNWDDVLLPRQDILESIFSVKSSQLSSSDNQDNLIHRILEWMKSISIGNQNYNIILPSGASRLESYQLFYSLFRAEKHRIKNLSFDASNQSTKGINPILSSREKRATSRLLSISSQDEKRLSSLLKNRSKRLMVKSSSIHSSGLFTLDSIPSGDFVIEYVGEVIGLRVSEKREKQYETLYGQDGCCYLFRIDGEYFVDATRKGNAARYINHSCDPNCIAKIIIDENDQKRIVFYTKKRISEGEEITYDYKFPKEDKKIPCHCGSKNCRGSLN